MIFLNGVERGSCRDPLAEHKLQGNPIAVWRNGKAVWIPPEEIVVPEI
ncbi:MAG TPA: hypothetical protein VJZ49_12175 [Syntrophales bacterium]|nr:hypothetical protein [Syntrophales bacterium]